MDASAKVEAEAMFERDLWCGVCGAVIEHEVRVASALNMGMLDAMMARGGMDAHLAEGATCDGGSTRGVRFGEWQPEVSP